MRLTRAARILVLALAASAVVAPLAPARVPGVRPMVGSTGLRAATYRAGQAVQVYTQAAHSGVYYGSTSTASGGGGVFEDVALSTSPGELICGSAWVRTQFPAIGASGTFVLWLLGGTSESGQAVYSGLGNLASWTEVHTCVEATASHTALRIQFYPAPGSPTVDMDDVDVHESLAANGGFEDGPGPWTVWPNTNSNYVDYESGSGTSAAHSGSHFGATNTTGGGGGIYQDVALNTTPGQLVCGSAWLRTEGSATGASGSFVLWLLGGTSESGQAVYSGLGNLASWTEVHTCVEATASHTALRIQFYPAAGSPTVEIDDVDVHESLAANGGFEDGPGPWTVWPNTNSNYVDYESGSGTSAAHSGSHFGATNTTGGGGGIYQDVALNTTPGQLVCGSAWLRTEGSATGASGSFVLWLLGGTSESGQAVYSGLGNLASWTEVHTCVEATASHTALRIQFYPAAGSPTVEIDDVDVHESLGVNAGFEYGSGPWGTYPNTESSYDVYRTGQVTGPATPVVSTPVSTVLPRSKARHALKVKLYLSWSWRYGMTRLEKVKIGRFPGRTHLTIRCRGRGCPRRHPPTAIGARHVRRLLRAWRGQRYRAGDVLRITLTAPRYTPEAAAVRIRYGRLPAIRRLSR